MQLGQGSASAANDSNNEKKPINLYPYQIEGVDWLANESSRFKLLADEMGLGKTVQVIRAADALNAAKTLILCPAIARFNWQREIGIFSFRTSRVQVTLTGKDIIDPEATHVVCSYDLAVTLKEKLEVFEWDILVCDEAHYLKSPTAWRTKAILGTGGLCRRAKRTWAVSGTPSPNHAAELWVWLFTFGLTPLLYKSFSEKYCTGYLFNRNFNVTGTRVDMIPEIRELLKPVMLRRVKESVLKDLPPIVYSHITVPPCPVDLMESKSMFQWIFPVDRTKELYEKIKKQEELVEKTVEHLNFTAAGLNALSNMATSVSTLRMYTGMQKLQATKKLVEEEFENKNYEKLVIFAIHKDVINNLRLAFKKYGPVTVYGGSDPVQREKNIKRFQENRDCKIIICNIQAAGTAINLTVAHHVLFVETDWTPAYVQQAAMRCHRIGQKKTVFVRFMGLENSIDDQISYALRKKTEQLTKIYAQDLQGPLELPKIPEEQDEEDEDYETNADV